LRLHLAAVGECDRRFEDHLIARLDAITYLDLRSEIARHCHLLEVRDAIVRHGHPHAVVTENQGVGRHNDGGSLARDVQVDGDIHSRTQRAVGIGNIDLGEQGSRAGR
jgi:hypothetical protein